MADLIDRQTIIETIHSAIYPYFCGAEGGDALSDDEKLVLSVNKTICTAIKELPSADAIEVVRCKDCKHYHPSYCEIWSRFGTMQTRENGYCYMGERNDARRI